MILCQQSVFNLLHSLYVVRVRVRLEINEGSVKGSGITDQTRNKCMSIVASAAYEVDNIVEKFGFVAVRVCLANQRAVNVIM